MIVALWIIAVCEIIRMLQNMVPVILSIKEARKKDNLYDEFIKSLRKDDREFVRDLLMDYEKFKDGRD